MKKTNSDFPLVSIGVPVYNGGAFLSQTICSILEQTYQNIEVVIRDNHSTDNSCEVIQEFVESDSRIRSFRSTHNHGAAKNYNSVFSAARGIYFKWAAADDLLAPTFVEQCVMVLEAQPEAVLAYPLTDVINQNGKTIESLNDNLGTDSKDPVKRYRSIRNSLRECNSVFGVIRTNILQQTNLIQPYLAADAHLLAELTLYGQFAEIPERLFFRRYHDAASSADRSEASQANFYDPERGGRPLMSNWSGLYYDLKATRGAPITSAEKLQIISFLLRKIVWNYRQYIRELSLYVNYLFRKIKGPGFIGHNRKAE